MVRGATGILQTRGAKDAIIVFLKAPKPGLVKTRLVPRIDAATAALLYRAMVEDLLERLGKIPSVDLLLHYAPEAAGVELTGWLGSDRRLEPQRGADLGERMSNAFRSAFESGYERAVIVGSDVPALTGRIVRAGLSALHRHDVALGPSRDGGYYLIGLSEAHPELFSRMRWSTRGVGAETVRRVKRLGLTRCDLPVLEDIDTYASLLRLRTELRTGAYRATSMPRVAAVVHSIRFSNSRPTQRRKT